MLSTLFLAAALSAPATDRPAIQGLPAVEPDRPAPRPPTSRAWVALSVRERLPLYAGPDSETRLKKADAPAFAELVYVMRKVPHARNAYLLARFRVDERGQRRFAGWLGWARGEDLLQDGAALTADGARRDLEKGLGKQDARWALVRRWMPLAADPRYRNVTLRAITDPETGTRAFADPVPAKGQRKAVEDALKTGRGTALAPFAFYHVAKIVIDGDDIHCLLTRRATMTISDTINPAVFKGNVLGWVPLSVLLFWTTREAFEPDFAAAAVTRRGTTGAPLTLWASLGELNRHLGGAADKALVPVYRESAADPLVKAYPWPANWTRYLLLEKHDLPRGRHAFRVGLLGGRGGQLVSLATTADMVKNLDLIRQTIENAHVVQLVLVIDGTNSMHPVIQATREALTAFVAGLQEEERKQPELTRLDLRIAVVVYTDHPDKFLPGQASPLVRDSGRYFKVKDPTEMAALRAYIAGITTAPNNRDPEEEPFEGIYVAANKFLRPGAGSLHTRGATSILLLIGNAGNSTRGRGFNGSPSTRLTLEQANAMLGPRRYDGGGVEERGARVMLFPVWTPYRPHMPEKVIWDQQMHALARASGGAPSEIEFFNPAQEKAAPGRLHQQVRRALEDARERLRKELDELRGKRIVRGGTPDKLDGPVHYQLAMQRLREVIGDDARFQLVVQQLSASFFAQAYTLERLPADGTAPRMRRCVLLTLSEVTRLANACKDIAARYRQELDDLDERKKGDADVYRELLLQTLAAVLGNISDAKKIDELRRLPLPALQDRISTLPVQIACLGRDGPRNDGEARKLCDSLDRVHRELTDLFTVKRDRWFYPGGDATAERHAWVYEYELP